MTKLRGAFACALACVRKNFLVKSRNCVSVRVKKTKISDKKISGLNVRLIAVATWSIKQHCTKRQLQSLTIFTLCAATGERSSAELTIRPITFDWITSSTRTSCGWEFSFHPGMVVASSMTTNRQLPHSWIFTPTHASLASVPLTHANGFTGPSRTRRPPLKLNCFQGPLRHYRYGQHLGSIPCLSQYSVSLR